MVIAPIGDRFFPPLRDALGLSGLTRDDDLERNAGRVADPGTDRRGHRDGDGGGDTAELGDLLERAGVPHAPVRFCSTR